MRILGLDIGTRRIGVALSDGSEMIASPLTMIEAHPRDKAIKAIAELVEEHGVGKLVIGLPLELSGDAGRAVRRTRRFVTKLQKSIDLPVEEWDERMSSVAAERALLEGDVSRAGRKEKIDMVAAAIILQNYLDAQSEC